MGFVTIRDVAARAGVSVSTVSRALNGTGPVSHQTYDQIQRSIKELDYVPDSRARSIRAVDSNVVGLIVHDIRNPFYANLVYFVQNEFLASGYSTFIGSFSRDKQNLNAYLQSMLQQRFDGALVVPSMERSEVIERMINKDFPLVFIGKYPWRKDVAMARVNVRSAMETAVKTLYERGHRQIGYISGEILRSYPLQEREHLFRKIAGPIVGDDNLFVESTGFNQTACAPVIKRMLRVGVTAVLCGDADDAVTILEQSREMNVRVGVDLSLVSFDDSKVFRAFSPRISVIRQDEHELGSVAVKMLLKRMKGTSVNSTFVDAKFVDRESISVINR
ncbi:LacI family DNA-binding transcriptional regulator [Bifidobacterium polysaccharolyticum]|uniref:LacI family DNA-binding transcriptional regulator n=1 Tax=Bifidobacterium polysaccharolyticum TaxID=2750967 RepID=UPI0021BA7CEB|nr:LacI family DNA-binding transcriptional regulator [Bifidobacterium polysaccharolyticum]MCT8157264.1 LacI family transcriptional regulator [Bifidobacterium polysaccharolyticum]